MSERPDPRDRPPDPAGTQPKVDLESLLPEHVDAIDAEAFEERPPQLGPGEGMALRLRTKVAASDRGHGR